MSDQLIRAISKDGHIKATAVSTRALTERARQIHKALPVATAALGRTLAAVSMMGNALKEDGAEVTHILLTHGQRDAADQGRRPAGNAAGGVR